MVFHIRLFLQLHNRRHLRGVAFHGNAGGELLVHHSDNGGHLHNASFSLEVLLRGRVPESLGPRAAKATNGADALSAEPGCAAYTLREENAAIHPVGLRLCAPRGFRAAYHLRENHAQAPQPGLQLWPGEVHGQEGDHGAGECHH